ncbi:MAG TPA: 16S rRNA (adenine(1518)-N(6)/adenine(1519)-N(6))-dimethyltransferase RsmA [Bacillota bacterium]|nr:16S rRNA (adenine(1518)-N(6)/adenine(1519)-N(6))-dimethyltransferase RsmA [Bacillota bacterium]HOL14629.1 16S rRNA (adenine(1518)-N(6)/adenine(1519)-N(6))-dimethyltransferase RsmA [Bacillota bacterium]
MPGVPGLPDLTSPRRLLLYLEQRGLRPRRGWGQNFLIDGNITRKVVEAAELGPGEAAVEIGPGAGALTAILARRSVRLLALELDRGLAAALEEMLRSFPHVRVLQKDALKVKWAELICGYFGPEAAPTLIANLPYQISGPLLYNLFKENFPFKKAVLMFQKEVAARLAAAPGSASYGALSVFCRYYAPAEILFPVSRQVFWPRPKVDSAVVKLQPRPRSLDAGEEELFWKIVQASFRQRRKILANSLGGVFSRSREELLSILHLAGVEPQARAEMLSMEQFAKIARIAYNY